MKHYREMAKKTDSQNGHSRLEDALASLIANQASFLKHLADADNRHADVDKRQADAEKRQAEIDKRQADAEMRHAEFLRLWAEVQRETNEKFSRLEETNAAILRVLAEHGRILERLPDTFRDKISFKVQDAKQ